MLGSSNLVFLKEIVLGGCFFFFFVTRYGSGVFFHYESLSWLKTLEQRGGTPATLSYAKEIPFRLQ